MKLTTKKQLMARYTILFSNYKSDCILSILQKWSDIHMGSKGTGWIITTHQRADVLGRIYPQFLL